jgi:hypothetical protein
MAKRNRTPDDHRDLEHLRATARATERAAAQLAEFADRIGAAVGPTEMLEYDTLIAREAAALSERVDAFGRLGFGAPSLDATGRDDA